MEYIDSTETPQCKTCLMEKKTCNGIFPCHRCEKLGIKCSLFDEQKRGTKRSFSALSESPNEENIDQDPKEKEPTIKYYRMEDQIPQNLPPTNYTVHHAMLDEALDFSIFRRRMQREEGTLEPVVPVIPFESLGKETPTQETTTTPVNEESATKQELESKISLLEKENLELKRFQFKNIPNLLVKENGVLMIGMYGSLCSWNAAFYEKLNYPKNYLRDHPLHIKDIMVEQDREPSFIKMTEALKYQKDYYEVEEIRFILFDKPNESIKAKAKYYMNFVHEEPLPFSCVCFIEFK